MKEDRRPFTGHTVHAMCSCGGELQTVYNEKDQPSVIFSRPSHLPPIPLYLHRCERCGIKENLKKIYPYMEIDGMEGVSYER